MRLKNYVTLVFLLNSLIILAHGGDRGVRFVENKGQWDSKILYRAAVPSGEMFFERTCLTFNLYDAETVKKAHLTGKNPYSSRPNMINFHAFKINFSGANFWAPTYGTEKTEEYYNYYIGKDQTRWKSNVGAYQTVTYKNIYDNVDLAVKGRGQTVKYEFIVAPGAMATNILLDFEGVTGLRMRNDNLIIETSVLSLQEQKPYAYQMIDGVETAVECRFVLNGNKVSYAFPDGYDLRYELVIDPNLVFCSYSGSLTDNWGYTATYDQFGNLYAGGITFDNGYPVTTGAFQQQFGLGSCDATISKYTSNGTAFVYSTYLGGNGAEQPHSMIVNSNNELYVYGTTGSDNFPVTTGCYDPTFGGGTPVNFDSGFINFPNGSDVYIARFKLDGSDLLSATYYGGTGNDGLNTSAILKYNYADQSRGEIFIDSGNNIIIGSSTLSPDLPITTPCVQPTLGGGQDGMIAKFNNNLTNLQWATYLGGSQDDAVYSVFIDKNNTVFATGGTRSPNFPITNGTLHPVYLGGDADAFVTHITGNGQQLLQSTFYGSDQYDQAYFIQVDKAGNVYIVGQTEATGNALISNAPFNTPGGNQFITKMSNNLSSLTWSTAFGQATGLPDIVPSAFLVDVCNKIYVSGWGGDLFGQNPNNAGTFNLPVSANAFQPNTDGRDYYLMIIDDAASQLVYGTFFGGPVSEEHVDGGTSRFDRQGVIYQSVCAGCGGLQDFPTTTGAVSQTNNSLNCNNGVFKFDFDFPLTIADFTFPLTGCAPFNTNFTNNSSGATSYVWNFGDSSPNSTDQNPAHTFNNPGTYSVTLIATNPANCNVSDTIVKQITITTSSSTTLNDTTVCPGQPVPIGIAPLADPNITYAWTPANVLDNPTVSNPIATVTQNTDFTMLVTYGGCVDTFFQTVNVSNALQLNVGPDKTICNGQSAGIGFVDNTGTFTYQWSPTTGLNNPTISNPIATPTETTTYILTGSNGAQGCEGHDTVTVFVTTTPPAADFEALFAPTCDALYMNLDNITQSTGPFYWNLGNGFIPATGDTTFLVQFNSSYTISLVAGTPPCSDTATYTINTVDFAGYMNMSNVNVFTPLNGDNLNNCFNPIIPPGFTGTPEEYPLAQCSKLIVYNRWGRKIYEGSGCWDGYNQGGSEVTEGVYYYIFEIAGIKSHGTVHVLKGGK